MSIGADIGHLTSGIRMNVKDVSDAWFMKPARRSEFGEREKHDLQEAALALWVLMREMEKQRAA